MYIRKFKTSIQMHQSTIHHIIIISNNESCIYISLDEFFLWSLVTLSIHYFASLPLDVKQIYAKVVVVGKIVLYWKHWHLELKFYIFIKENKSKPGIVTKREDRKLRENTDILSWLDSLEVISHVLKTIWVIY